MARRPREQERAALELDHLHTEPAGGANARRRTTGARAVATRRSRRPAIASIGLVTAAFAVLLAGGALFSGASGVTAAALDPLANTVRATGGAPDLGASPGLQLNENLVGIAATPTGRGYWAVASDGGIFTFGDAGFHGSLAGRPLAAPIVGIAPSPTGDGYWLAGRDGGVFAFGDAAFHGAIRIPAPLMSPVVGIAATPTGGGYWLAGSDGGVFAFGDAVFRGATTSVPHAPVVGIAASPSGRGYHLLAADGGVFSFGDAPFAGTAVDGQHLATAIGVPAGGRGYQITRTDGSVVGLGGAASSPAPVDLLSAQHPTIGIAPRRGGGAWLVTTWVPPRPAESPSQDPFLRCTRAHESDHAGGYRAVSPGGVYRGAYQFLPSTWNNVARAAGRPDLVGVDPAAASPADQDQLALFLYRRAGAAPWGGRCAGLS
jgi:hypothetical protein